MVDTLVAIARETHDAALAAQRWWEALVGKSPFDATHALALAALSPDAAVRHVAAEALVSDVHVVGANLILDHLAGDQSALVRASVVRAARARRPSLDGSLLARLGIAE